MDNFIHTGTPTLLIDVTVTDSNETPALETKKTYRRVFHSTAGEPQELGDFSCNGESPEGIEATLDQITNGSPESNLYYEVVDEDLIKDNFGSIYESVRVSGTRPPFKPE